MNKAGYPGMKILQFAFGNGPKNEYLPHNYDHNNQVVYGGTHDNETIEGYFRSQKPEKLKYAMEYMNVNDPSKLTDAVIRMGYATSSNAAIYQVQDILELDNSARMNEPSTVGKNWQWRLAKGQLTEAHMERVKSYTCIYGRD
jgi:4-alpha-glucanotransferase